MKVVAAIQAEIEAVAKGEEHCSIDLNVENISKLPDDDNSQEREGSLYNPSIPSMVIRARFKSTRRSKGQLTIKIRASVNPKPNVTFGSYLDTHYLLPSVPSRKDLNPLAPRFAMEGTRLQPPAPSSVKFHPETSVDSLVFSTSENDPSPCVSTTEDSLTRLADLLRRNDRIATHFDARNQTYLVVIYFNIQVGLRPSRLLSKEKQSKHQRYCIIWATSHLVKLKKRLAVSYP